ncbi:MAG: site-specific DNA-methyltransferase [Chlorobiaceae bacterium]
MAKKQPTSLNVETLRHDEATRKNIPTAEHQSVMEKDEQNPIRVAYDRRNRDLDPQLVWRGKDEQDWSDLVVQAPPLYIQEKVHPKVLIDDLLRRSKADAKAAEAQIDLFADFNGLPDDNARTEFYKHDAHWANRMILGDSLQVMASLAEREGLRGQVQCIYLDPPYGIKFNSNFQWSTTSRDVKDGNTDHITREPEQVKAFRDTWRDGIHSYLTYLRDRFTVARDLLTESGSIFVQIGDENVHRVRALMDEVFGENNCISSIWYKKNAFDASSELSNVFDNILWYSKTSNPKIRNLYEKRTFENSDSQFFDSIELLDGQRRQLTSEEKKGEIPLPIGASIYARNPLTSGGLSSTSSGTQMFEGYEFPCAPNSHWKTPPDGMMRLIKAHRVTTKGTRLRMVRFIRDNEVIPMTNLWNDTGTGGFVGDEKFYIVQTDSRAMARCMLMATDPGDLVLDPTCGSGTTAYVAEQWGRRWITIDTSRVALALARARIMGARYPYYILADSRDGQLKEAEINDTAPSSQPVKGDIRHGFVYERVPHITLKSIANNAEIDVIWENFQRQLEPLREQLNTLLHKSWQEWEIPREADTQWSEEVTKLHAAWWKIRMERQQEIDSSIAAKAESEYLYDKPYPDKKKVRVAGPFTVESISPHRVLGVDENDALIDNLGESSGNYGQERSFVQMILENLRNSGVQQAHKEDKIIFTLLTPWPGDLVCAEGRYSAENESIEKRAAIFIGPEFGTVSRPDLVAAAREAGDADFDVLITCAFNYDAHSSEFNKLGRIPVLKARMNADLHMADDLKNTGKGNLFVIFGEPDIDILNAENGQVQVQVNGVDVFHPNTGEVRSDGAEGIACWFIDTDYNMESFFVRHAYFLGANDPYKALKTTLKAEINQEVWATLNSNISRPFDKPETGRIAVKVINHLGDEVMKVFRVT